MKLAIVGTGRMGQAVTAEAALRGHQVIVSLDGASNRGGCGVSDQRFRGVDVALEFTRPDAAASNLAALLSIGVPVVTGTTGWQGELARIEAQARECRGALLYAANFSVGVQLFLRTAHDLAARLATRPEFDAAILERHHTRKLDAPSGTALALQTAVRRADPARTYSITSIRVGDVPGSHSLMVEAPHESITFTHETRDRRVFAAGAVQAAEWLQGKVGVFTFEQMLFGEGS
jgi:4-hydroxy-tetrahydrodipicolinate reductase